MRPKAEALGYPEAKATAFDAKFAKGAKLRKVRQVQKQITFGNDSKKSNSCKKSSSNVVIYQTSIGQYRLVGQGLGVWFGALGGEAHEEG